MAEKKEILIKGLNAMKLVKSDAQHHGFEYGSQSVINKTITFFEKELLKCISEHQP